MIVGAILLLVLAFGLVAAELVVPSHGVLTAFAAGAAVGAVWMAYKATPGMALVFAVVILVVTPVVFFYAVKIYPSTTVGKKVLLQQPTAAATQGFGLEREKLELLVGRQGVAVSNLRPSGMVEVDGLRINAASESEMIEPGAAVEVIRVSGMKVIVKGVE